MQPPQCGVRRQYFLEACKGIYSYHTPECGSLDLQAWDAEQVGRRVETIPVVPMRQKFYQ